MEAQLPFLLPPHLFFFLPSLVRIPPQACEGSSALDPTERRQNLPQSGRWLCGRDIVCGYGMVGGSSCMLYRLPDFDI